MFQDMVTTPASSMLGERKHSRPQGHTGVGCCSPPPPPPPHLVGKAAPLQDACTATSSVIVFHFRSSSSASTTFLHLPAPRSVMPDRGSKWVGWVAHLVEASRLVLGWICEGLCRTMLQVIIDPPLHVVYAFYRSSTTPLSPLPTGSALVL
jgi:hypothetical protein